MLTLSDFSKPGAFLASLCLLNACGPQAGEKSFTQEVKEAAAEAAYTGPALWRLEDVDTTVFLFGTVHTLRPDTEWQTELVTNTLLQSDAVYFEADINSTRAQGEINRAITDLGLLTDGRTLEDILPDEAEREVNETADLLGVPLYSINNFQPWLASFSLSNIHHEKQGFDNALGVEKVLTALAEDRAIPIRYLETGAYQMSLIASVPEVEQVSLLVHTANKIESDPDFLNRMIADWSVGDVPSLTEAFSDDPVFANGEIHNLMLRTRNANWSHKITKLMEEQPGTFFVAVGAAHLAGDESLQTLMDALGVKSERVNPPPAAR